MSDSGDPEQDEARLREEWERRFAPLCPGDPCPRCQSTDTRVMRHEEQPGLVCSTCGYGT